MQFSFRLPVATHVLLCLDKFQGVEKTTSTFLAGSVNVNPVIIRKILGRLKAAGLVAVTPGVGGATLTRDPKDITLGDVFQAVEDEAELFHFQEHPNPNCPVGRSIQRVLVPKLAQAKAAMLAELKAVTLAELAAAVDGDTPL
ncbi:MAG: Rrf2 family transcriptional regulator [Selenomonadaceae bacterium]|nr:Rrf2 family transcriptional regulator [Selenomonadaceae bacterium]